MTFSMERAVPLTNVPDLFDRLSRVQQQQQQQPGETLEGLTLTFIKGELTRWLGSLVAVQQKGLRAVVVRSIEIRLPEIFTLPICTFTFTWSYMVSQPSIPLFYRPGGLTRCPDIFP